MKLVLSITFAAATLCAQESAVETAPPATSNFTVEIGSKVPLALINSVSTKHSAEGDRVYLETVFPILVNGRIVVPVGSWVTGTVTQIKKPGRVKGRGELYVRFDSLTLPNGVTRDFRARIGGMDGNSKDELDRAEGKVRSEGNKAGDARSVGEAAAAGASVGVIAGRAAGQYGKGGGGGRCAAFARTGRGAGEGDHARDGAGPGAELQRKRAEFRGLSTAAHGQERGTAQRAAEEPFIHTTARAPVSGIAEIRLG